MMGEPVFKYTVFALLRASRNRRSTERIEVLRRNGKWDLSPVFGVAIQPRHGGTLSIATRRDGDSIVNVENLLKVCQNLGCEPEGARIDLRLMAEQLIESWGSDGGRIQRLLTFAASDHIVRCTSHSRCKFIGLL